MSKVSVPQSVKADQHLGVNGNQSQAVDAPPPWVGDADFEQLKAPAFLATAAPSPTLAKIIPRKPRGQEYVRVHPGEDWRGTYGLVRDERSDIQYVVTPALYGALADELVTHVVLTAINAEGELFLWPAPLCDAGGRTNSWWESGLEGAERAQRAWVRLKRDLDRGRYDVREALSALPEPTWPDAAFGELFRLAFRDLVVASLEHPFVRRLRGER